MDYQRIAERIAAQIRDFAAGFGFTDAVIGLSGGLDSSVVAPLCAQAIGAEHVHGVLLPGPYSSDASAEDAQALAENLGIGTATIPITGAYDAFASALAPYTGGALEGLASENTQARCRMVALMALSNAHGWMLVNTGNRTEALLGYCTLYGDTAGAFAPIGGLYKTQVFALARHLNNQAVASGGTAPIPQRVLDRPPSAELAPDQTDEEGLGHPYAELDRILAGYFDEGRGADELASDATDAKAAAEIIARAERAAFKRIQLPPAADVSAAPGA